MTTTFNFRPATATPTDTTAGRLTKVGDFGIGGAIDGLSTSNINQLVISGNYYFANPSTASGDFPPDILADSFNGSVVEVSSINSRPKQVLTGVRVRSGPNNQNRTWQRVFNADTGSWTPWRQVYNQGSILGTVSQSGGVPTGAIIEQGSNANGRYVRFADGTQLAWNNDSLSITNAASATKNITWPVSFSSLQAFVATGAGGNTSDNDFGRYLATTRVDNAAPSIRMRHIAGTNRTDTLPFSWFAAGRWF